MLIIAPWEASMISPIEKAIQKSDIGINPSNDGKVIRLMVPELTAERRKDLCKQVKKRIEEGKVAIRAIRRDAMESIKKMKKDSQITEDDQKAAEKELQKLTDSKIETIDKVGAAKEKEIMEGRFPGTSPAPVFPLRSFPESNRIPCGQLQWAAHVVYPVNRCQRSAPCSQTSYPNC